jgi:hypothetical protein
MKRFLVGLMVAAMATIGFASVVSASNNAWTEYVYNPSGHALMPLATTTSATGTVVSFNFALGVYTALLTTRDRSLTGDLSSKSLTDAVSVTNMNDGATFQDQNGDGCATAPSVRLYFTSPAGSGPSYPPPGPPINGTPPAGFYTQSWWSNPALLTLTNNVSGTITATLDPSQWSDWDGQMGNSSADVTAAFLRAAQNVQTVGLSFGGGCFAENGVTTSDGSGTFNSSFSESP